MSSTTEESDWHAARVAQKPSGDAPIPEDSEISFTRPHHTLEQATLPVPNHLLVSASSHASPAPVISGVSSHDILQNPAQHVPIAPSPQGASTPIRNPNESGSASQQPADDDTFKQMAATIDQNAEKTDAGLARGGTGVATTAANKRNERQNRGGRKPQIKIEPPSDEIVPDGTVMHKANRGGKPRGNRATGNAGGRGTSRGIKAKGSRAATASTSSRALKRKRQKGIPVSDEEEMDNTDSSEEITALPTQSRSGRRITQASLFSLQHPTPSPQNTNKQRLSPSMMEVTASAHLSPAATMYSRPSSAKQRKRIIASAVCLNCLRGPSPSTNQIVFCDTCNTPYHQFCHDPPIHPSVILVEEEEWHCSECKALADESALLADCETVPDFWATPEKREYLQSLDRSVLVALLLRFSDVHPNLPIYKPLSVTSSASKVASVHPHPPTATNAPNVDTNTPQAKNFPRTNASAVLPPLNANQLQTPPMDTGTVDNSPSSLPAFQPKSLEFVYPESEPLPYPKAGNGVALRPEVDELDILMDNDEATFSHSWRIVPPVPSVDIRRPTGQSATAVEVSNAIVEGLGFVDEWVGPMRDGIRMLAGLQA